MALKISDWLSFLNQEISSYEAEQNMYYSIFWVILAVVRRNDWN